MTLQYDDDDAITQYVWSNYAHLLSEPERVAGEAVRRHMHSGNSSSPRQAIVRDDGLQQAGASPGEPPAGPLPSPDARLDAALAADPALFLRQTRDRLLSEHVREIQIHRCPRCHCVLRAPADRHCFWCGHDWYPRDGSN